MTDTPAAGVAPRAAKAGSAKPFFSEGYKRLVLALLVSAYTFNLLTQKSATSSALQERTL